jgi:hypothetical protein
MIYMAENGQMAIHLPLTNGRVGAFSTHTAHPKVIARSETLLGNILEVPLRIVNPYVYATKAEVTGTVVQALPESIVLSNSCWRSARLTEGAPKHCGACIPCYLRRIALEFHGPDPTAYARDPWSENVAKLPEQDDARRNLVDLAEFVVRFGSVDNEEILSEYPELRSSYFNMTAVIDMYRRSAEEAQTVLGRYPRLGFLLN